MLYFVFNLLTKSVRVIDLLWSLLSGQSKSKELRKRGLYSLFFEKEEAYIWRILNGLTTVSDFFVKIPTSYIILIFYITLSNKSFRVIYCVKTFSGTQKLRVKLNLFNFRSHPIQGLERKSFLSTVEFTQESGWLLLLVWSL